MRSACSAAPSACRNESEDVSTTSHVADNIQDDAGQETHHYTTACHTARSMPRVVQEREGEGRLLRSAQQHQDEAQLVCRVRARLERARIIDVVLVKTAWVLRHKVPAESGPVPNSAAAA